MIILHMKIFLIIINKKFKEVDFKIKKIHRYYIKALIQNNDFTDIPNVIDKFKKDTGYNILLSKQDIRIIKSNIFQLNIINWIY